MHRTPGLIRRDSPEHYRLVLAVAGNPIIAQDGRETRLKEGEFAVYDFPRPYDLAYDSAVRLAVLTFPHDALGLTRDIVGRLTAAGIASQTGAGPSPPRSCAAWPRMWRPTVPPARRGAARLSAVALDLLTTAVAERADQEPEPSVTALIFSYPLDKP